MFYNLVGIDIQYLIFFYLLKTRILIFFDYNIKLLKKIKVQLYILFFVNYIFQNLQDIQILKELFIKFSSILIQI